MILFNGFLDQLTKKKFIFMVCDVDSRPRKEYLTLN